MLKLNRVIQENSKGARERISRCSRGYFYRLAYRYQPCNIRKIEFTMAFISFMCSKFSNRIHLLITQHYGRLFFFALCILYYIESG